jgi:tryptophanyl-tRNA synthetase
MACDILMYDAHVVPVGKDQKQHLEITRDLASSFNHIYGETLVVPESEIQKNVMIVPGVDGQKMSKSYNNFINIFASKKELKKQVMSIVTDNTPLEEPKDPESSIPFQLFSLMADADQIEAMRANYLAGGYGYGHAKKELLELILEKFGPAREAFDNYMNNLDVLEAELRKGADKARVTADATLARMREKVGFRTL